MLLQPQLPKEYIDWITKPLQRFLHIESGAAAILLFSTVLALIISNTSCAKPFFALWATPIGIHIGDFDFTRTIQNIINDGVMTLFFFIIALELKREVVFGELGHIRSASLSIIAALGGMLVPALIYLVLMSGHEGQHGWGTVMATDTAFVIGCLMLLGERVPRCLYLFMLSLAVVDDIGAILIVGIGYTHHINWILLCFSLVGFLLIKIMASLGVRSIIFYFIIGAFIWFIIDASGVHATITGVILGFMTPAKRWVNDELLHNIFNHVITYAPWNQSDSDKESRIVLKTAQTAAQESLSPLERLETMLHPWVAYCIVPIFALANAGVTITSIDFNSRVTVGIFLGFLLGKPIGVFSFSWIAIKSGIATKPNELTWMQLVGGSFLAGIGFTMALFIADLSFAPGLLSNAKFGILIASICSGLIGVILLGLASSKIINNQYTHGQNN